ncbi:hypothetical protein EJ06DRAFT_529768 [Trichodelitschia bisporula]|uniref:Uncharacterized protein n=1 Tax=Trichodelitschia bisporula TaxID=703511 RepID=A0A6G1HXH0_9PEZI|nr:hypothetical protein EJ06DRAFT_529768 [Trichodelitschia bisporula]
MFEGPGCYMEWGGAHAPADMPKACVECTTPKTEQNVPLPPSSADLGAPTSDAKENSEETSASISFIGDRAAPEAVSHETTTLLPSAPARRILNPSSRLARAGPQLDLKVPLPPSQFEFGVSGSVFDFTVKQQAFQLPPIPSFANPANENLMDLSHCNNEAEGNTERFKLTEYEDIEEKDTGDEDEEEDEEDEVKPDTTTRVYSTVGGPFFAAIEERCPEIRMGDSGAYKAVEEPVTTAQGDNEAAEEAKKKKKKRGGKGRKKNGKGLKGGKGGKGKK